MSHHSRDGSEPVGQRHGFQFITLSCPEAIKARHNQRLLRKHAKESSLHHRRQRLIAAGSNFVMESGTKSRTHLNGGTFLDADIDAAIPRSPPAYGGTGIDPFETLPICASRLTALLGLRTSVAATEPIIALGDIVQGDALRSTFGVGLEDPALTTAFCLSLSFAANHGVLSVECLTYRAEAIKQLRRRIENSDSTETAPAVGTTLFLLGIEYRLGDLYSARAHLNGLKALLLPRTPRAFLLPESLRRAIFWQDLFASLILGTTRITSYNLYSINSRISFVPKPWHSGPPGFVDSIGILGGNFVAVTADIADLHYACRTWPASTSNVDRTDGLQAWIESRLQDLQSLPCNEALTSCILAAFLCTYGCWIGVWNSALLPDILTRKLLKHLQTSELWTIWDGHWKLLCWCICVAIAFAREQGVRESLAALKIKTPSGLMSINSLSWPAKMHVLQKFIWSEVMYSPERGYFWQLVQEAP